MTAQHFNDLVQCHKKLTKMQSNFNRLLILVGNGNAAISRQQGQELRNQYNMQEKINKQARLSRHKLLMKELKNHGKRRSTREKKQTNFLRH